MTDLGVGLISQPSEIFFWISSTKHEDDSLTMRIHLAISGSLVGVSLLTVTLIGVDRYLALKLIKLHLRYKELITTRRAICTAVVHDLGLFHFHVHWHLDYFKAATSCF